MWLPNPLGHRVCSNPSLVTGIYDPLKSRAQHHRKARLKLKIYDVIYWETNNYSTLIDQYLKN